VETTKPQPFVFTCFSITNGGEAGIRTLGGLLTLNGFQDRRIQPLCHLSEEAVGYRKALEISIFATSYLVLIFSLSPVCFAEQIQTGTV
jgi:hypothetical protein